MHYSVALVSAAHPSVHGPMGVRVPTHPQVLAEARGRRASGSVYLAVCMFPRSISFPPPSPSPLCVRGSGLCVALQTVF